MPTVSSLKRKKNRKVLQFIEKCPIGLMAEISQLNSSKSKSTCLKSRPTPVQASIHILQVKIYCEYSSNFVLFISELIK